MEIPPKSSRPMPRSKKKELEANFLISSAIHISALDDVVPVKRSTMIVHSEDESEYSGDESSASEGLDQAPTNLPEPIDVVDDDFSDSSSLTDAADALEGADVFKDVKVEQDIPEKGNVAEEEEEEEEKLVEHEEEEVPAECSEENEEQEDERSMDTDSSVDLGDLAFDFSPEELREIRRKRRQERREIKAKRLEQDKIRQDMLAKAKKDRFFDKSRNIPGEIYFGEIKVPLHVLYSYGSDDDRRSKKVGVMSSSAKHSRIGSKSSAGSSVSKIVKPMLDHRIDKMRKYLKAAGVKYGEYKSYLKGNKHHIYNDLLEVLRKYGLEGEPTLAKCRELKKSICQSSDDDLDLDTSVIINPNGRTLRSGTTIVQDEDSLEPPPRPPDDGIPPVEKEIVLEKSDESVKS